MSISILNRGASGGMTASIIVKGLGEADTVTASNGSKTKNGVWTPDSLLPSGFTKLEYIESTGTQYIDTEYFPNPNTMMEAEVQMAGTFKVTANGSLFGVRDGTAAYTMNFGNGYNLQNTLYPWFDKTHESGASILNFDITDAIRTNRNTVSVNRGSITWGGITATTATKTTTQTLSMVLFGCKWDGAVVYPFESYNMRVFAWKIFDNGICVRNYIPAKRVSGGEIGLYDLVEGKFYGNNGTGKFVAGRVSGRHEINGITDLGVWTVTAINGDKTDVQNVLIEVIGLYAIEMSYKTWLYREGDLCEALTGGYSTQSVHQTGGTDSNEGILAKPSVTFNSGNMSISQSLGSNRRNTVGQTATNNTIDLTNYTKFKIHIVNATIYSSSAGSQHIAARFTKSKSSGYSIDFDIVIVAQSGKGTTDTKEDVIIEGDISHLTGSYYFLILTRSVGSLVADKIWLE